MRTNSIARVVKVDALLALLSGSRDACETARAEEALPVMGPRSYYFQTGPGAAREQTVTTIEIPIASLGVCWAAEEGVLRRLVDKPFTGHIWGYVDMEGLASYQAQNGRKGQQPSRALLCVQLVRSKGFADLVCIDLGETEIHRVNTSEGWIGFCLAGDHASIWQTEIDARRGVG